MTESQVCEEIFGWTDQIRGVFLKKFYNPKKKYLVPKKKKSGKMRGWHKKKKNKDLGMNYQIHMYHLFLIFLNFTRYLHTWKKCSRFSVLLTTSDGY